MNILDTRQYIESFLRIRDKKGSIAPFRLNAAQSRLHEALEAQRLAGKPMRVIILKARQMGFSTYTEGRIFADTATHFNAYSMVVAHSEEATANIFGMSKRFYDYLPAEIRPMQRASNANEIVFDNPDKKGKRGLGSVIRCITAGGRGIGRSFTLRNLHISEYAFWPGNKEETLLGLLQAVADEPETMVVIESTANGLDNFYELWQQAVKGESDYIPFFAAWWQQKEYRKKPPVGFTLTEEEQKIADELGLDMEQMCWRRSTIANKCGGSLDKFHQEYPATPDEAFIFSGTPVFDVPALMRRKQEAPAYIRRGDFSYHLQYDDEGMRISKMEFTEDNKGAIRIWKEPVKGRPYVIGGDTAGEGSDMFVAQVLDNITGEQVAVLRHQYDEDRYADQVYCLGRYYNDALVGIETNFSTHPVKRLQELAYPKQFVRKKEDSYTGAISNSYGFKTTGITRPLIIGELVGIFRDHPENIVDMDTIDEMLTFMYNEHYRPEAMEGKHDDCVMALAIAYYIRCQQDTKESDSNESFGEKWRDDQWDDYYKADEETKKYLRRKWR